MSIRTLVVFALLGAVAAPASAQEVATPAPYVYSPPAAPTPAPAAASAPRTLDPVLVESGFELRDRRGRELVAIRHEMQSDRGLWGLGIGLFAAGWALDIIGTGIFNGVSEDRSGANEEDAMAWSIVPLVGPFIQLGIQAPHPALPITSGLLQITGLVLFIVGITSQHDAEIPVYAWGDPADARTARLGLDLQSTNGGAYATLTLHTM